MKLIIHEPHTTGPVRLTHGLPDGAVETFIRGEVEVQLRRRQDEIPVYLVDEETITTDPTKAHPDYPNPVGTIRRR